jgi:transposase
LREKVARGRIALRLANLPPCLIGIEAGMATHYVARELAALGHDVKQVPATYAKPFRCAEFAEAVNANLNRLGVVVGDTVDVFGAAHGRLQSHS